MALAGTPRRSPETADGLRLPPHSVEAEQAVLGGLMIDASAWDSVADIIRAADFYRRDHQLVFEAIAELVEKQNPCDAVTSPVERNTSTEASSVKQVVCEMLKFHWSLAAALADALPLPLGGMTPRMPLPTIESEMMRGFRIASRSDAADETGR